MLYQSISQYHKSISRKGQYLIVEEVLLFGMGVVILGGILLTFNFIHDNMLSSLAEGESKTIHSYIYSNIISLSNSNLSKAYIEFNIPEKIGENTYIVEGTNKKLVLASTNGQTIEKDLPLEISGRIQSTSKRARIEFDENSIILRGVGY